MEKCPDSIPSIKIVLFPTLKEAATRHGPPGARAFALELECKSYKNVDIE